MNFTVILKEHGDNKLGVVRAIMALTAKSVSEAKKIAESAPSVVASYLAESEATRIKNGLEACGATVSTESVTELHSEPPNLTSEPNPSFLGGSAAVASQRVPINRFFFLRAGVVAGGDTGDFIENQAAGLAFAVAFCDSQSAPMVISHEQLGTEIFPHDDFREAMQALVPKLRQSIFKPLILIGLLKSTLDRDADGLVDVDEDYEQSFFEASETDDVNDHAPCIFGLGSVSNDVSEVFFDITTKSFTQEGSKLATLMALYGRIDEDEKWVVGVRV
jgi:Ribosomal protein L7/L12 C-terminal domain